MPLSCSSVKFMITSSISSFFFLCIDFKFSIHMIYLQAWTSVSPQSLPTLGNALCRILECCFPGVPCDWGFFNINFRKLYELPCVRKFILILRHYFNSTCLFWILWKGLQLFPSRVRVVIATMSSRRRFLSAIVLISLLSIYVPCSSLCIGIFFLCIPG